MNTLTHAFKRGYRHFSGCLNMEDGDIVLASFPRSGNTWFRTLFANCLKLKSGQESTTTMIELADYMPVLGYSNLGKTGPDFHRPRLIKTHRLPWEIKPFRPQKILLLWREPVGAMKSGYRYYSANRKFQTTDISNFIRDKKLGMPAWKKHYLSWENRATVTLQYRAMRDQTAVEFSSVLKQLGYEELLPFVEQAVELASLENMTKTEKQGIRDPDRFTTDFRSIGGGDQDKTKLADSDMEYIQSMTKEISID